MTTTANPTGPALPPPPSGMNANDPALIGLLLEAFHDGLPEQWSPAVEAEAFLLTAQAQYPKATKAFLDAQAIDLIAHELRKLEEAKRRAARKLRSQALAQQRARDRIKAERQAEAARQRKLAEAAGEEYTEPEGLDDVDDSEVEDVKSIFDLIVNTVAPGVNKRLGAWTLSDMGWIEGHYLARAAGYFKYAETVSDLQKRFLERRDEELAAAKKKRDKGRLNELQDDELTVAQVLSEDEVREIWSDVEEDIAP